MIRKIIKLRKQKALDYYFDGGAVTDPLGYFVGPGTGKEPLAWIGRGARALGIEGSPVCETAMRRMFDGRHPQTDEILSANELEVRAYEISIGAPKSVSIAMMLPELRTTFEEAHNAAAAVAAAYIEAALCQVRRRSAGEQRHLPADAVMAPLLHRVNRLGEPHLHTHLLIFALAHREGTWSAIWSDPLARNRTAGLLYQAALRSKLVEHGFSFEGLDNGAAEILGVPAALRSLFSKRRAEIEKAAAEGGGRTLLQLDEAALTTRPKSPPVIRLEESAHAWATRAELAGFDVSRIYEDARQVDPCPLADPEEAVEALLGGNGLTEKATSVRFEEMIDSLAAMFPSLGADRLLMAASHLATHPGIRQTISGTRMTTVGMLGIEAEIERLAELAYSGRSVLTAGRARQLLKKANLDEEMADAAVKLLTSPRLVTVLTGPAGSAKTSVIAACAPIWRGRDAYPHGATLAALLARSLKQHHHIEASTVASLLQGRRKLPEASVLIVEEASMVGSRALLRLISLAREAGGRVVLVGDSSQLPEIEAAGGVFASLAERPEAIQLRSVVRQCDEVERGLLVKLREGQYRDYIDWAELSARLRSPKEMDQVAEQMALEYVGHVRTEGFDSTLLVARSWGQLHVLNRRLRELLREGESPLLESPPCWFRANAFQICRGERLLLRRNSHKAKLMNGMVGTVWGIDIKRGVDLQLDDGTIVRVPRSYIDADDDDGHPLVAYAYATTAHRAQGMTAERSLVVLRGDESSEWGYVALSRARGTTTVWTLKDPASPHRTAGEVLAKVLERSESQETASSQVLLAVGADEYLGADEAWDESDALWELLAADRNQVIAETADSLRGENDANFGIRLALSLEAWRRQETAVLPRWRAVMARLEDVAPLRYDDGMEDWFEIWEDLLTKPLFEIVDEAKGAASPGGSGPASPSALPVLAPRPLAGGDVTLTQDALDFGDPAA